MSSKKTLFDWFDDLVRHRSVLGRHAWLRDLLRKPYHYLLRLNPEGYSLRLGGCIDVRLPPEFRSKLMESHEVEEFVEIKRWCGEVDAGWFVDVGCSVGYMSCAALSANASVNVLAIDTDLNSLQSAGRVCTYAGPDRLHRVHALISEKSKETVTMESMQKRTAELLGNPEITGDPGTHTYVNLDHPEAGNIPPCSLDDLMRSIVAVKQPILIKCDIEGAEYGALLGLEVVMKQARPRLLLSVHPDKLKVFGYSREMVSGLLDKRGYFFTEIAADHELHWLCVPAANAESA